MSLTYGKPLGRLTSCTGIILAENRRAKILFIKLLNWDLKQIFELKNKEAFKSVPVVIFSFENFAKQSKEATDRMGEISAN